MKPKFVDKEILCFYTFLYVSKFTRLLGLYPTTPLFFHNLKVRRCSFSMWERTTKELQYTH